MSTANPLAPAALVAYEVGQHLVLRPIEGASLRQTLTELLSSRGAGRAEVRGHGRIDAARLVGVEARSGVLEVVVFDGSVAGDELHVSLLARAEDGTLVSGRLVDARAVELELSVQLLTATVEKAPAERAPAEKPARLASATSWAEVAAASAARQAEPAEDDEDEEAIPSVGDHLEHPTFGLCTIAGIDADEEFIMARTSTQRLLRLSLDVLRLVLVGEEGGHRLFRARGKGR